MANEFYTATNVTKHTLGRAAEINSERAAVEAAFDLLPAKLDALQARVTYVTATGPANTYAATMTPTNVAYVDGLAISFTPNVDNTGASTINIDGLGARSILQGGGAALAADDLLTTGITEMRYNGTAFIITSQDLGGAAGAAASAAAAALIYDTFDDRYLGSKAVAPTLDNDGDALLTGAEYWDSVLNARYTWDGAAWQSSGVYNAASVAITGGTISGITSLSATGGTITGITDLAIADGGTGASVAATALSNLGGAPLASPTLTGTPSAPTATPATNTTQIATTAYADAIAALKANIASPTLTGVPLAPTATPATNTTQIATTAYADAIAALKANLASPTFTGTVNTADVVLGGETITTVDVLTSATSISLDLTTGSAGFLTLDHDTTITISGEAIGQWYTLVIKQGSTGGTVAWAGVDVWLNGGAAPTASAVTGAYDTISFFVPDTGVVLASHTAP